ARTGRILSGDPWRCHMIGLVTRRFCLTHHRTTRTLPLLPLLLLSLAAPAVAQPAGTMTWGVHVTLATRWLDTSETESEITPFMILYALHDALVKPMPGNLNTPCLAEASTMSKDGRTWDFVLRK